MVGEVWTFPATCGLVGASLAATFGAAALGDPHALSNSYVAVVLKRQFWRLALAPLAHSDPVELALNVVLLWSQREVESYLGSLEFLRRSFVLLVLCTCIHVGWLHQWMHSSLQGGVPGRQQLKHWDGVSTLLFAWHAVQLTLPFVQLRDSIALFGVLPVSLAWSDLALLAIVHSLAWRACPVNNWSGLAAGYLAVVGGVFDWLTPYFSFCLAQWLAVLLLFSDGPPRLRPPPGSTPATVPVTAAAAVTPGSDAGLIQVVVPARLASSGRGGPVAVHEDPWAVSGSASPGPRAGARPPSISGPNAV